MYIQCTCACSIAAKPAQVHVNKLTTSFLQGHSQSGTISNSTVPNAGDCRNLHIHLQQCVEVYTHAYTIVYIENHVHSTLAINKHEKESRHGQQTLTHNIYVIVITKKDVASL